VNAEFARFNLIYFDAIYEFADVGEAKPKKYFDVILSTGNKANSSFVSLRNQRALKSQYIISSYEGSFEHRIQVESQSLDILDVEILVSLVGVKRLVLQQLIEGLHIIDAITNLDMHLKILIETTLVN